METKTMYQDLIDLQSDLPKLKKDATNPFFKSKYASLDTITEQVFPVLQKHNFTFVALPSANQLGEPTLKYFLQHTSGESLAGEMKLLLKAEDPQAQGSAITYARRYALCALLGLVADEDDDGNASTQVEKKTPQTSDTASDKQIEFLTTMLKRKGATSLGDVKKILNQVVEVDKIEGLDKEQASVVIDFVTETKSEQIKELLL